MLGRYRELSRHARVFRGMTGLTVAEFDAVVRDVLPAFGEARQERLSRPDRKRKMGAGAPAALTPRDAVLLTVVWLRQYPTYLVLGYLWGVSETTVMRVVQRLAPLLAADGRQRFTLPAPGTRSRRGLDALLADVPGLALVVDTFEQHVQRPQRRADADGYYSGKKTMHTVKSQVVVDERDGCIVAVAASVPGPTNDLALLRRSGVLERLPAGVGVLGDLAYVGVAQSHPLGCTPRRKPRKQPRPAEDVAYNTAFARRRIVVEHSIGRMRRYRAVSERDRHHRRWHSVRVCAAAGLANRPIRGRLWGRPW